MSNVETINNRLTTASEVIDALGGTKKMSELLGVGAAAVSNYRNKGFAASKYMLIDQLCTENGLNVADAVFGNIKRRAAAQDWGKTLQSKDDADFMGFSPTGFEEAATAELTYGADFLSTYPFTKFTAAKKLQRKEDTDKPGLAAWQAAGFAQLPDLPILQPAAPFIALVGAEMQQRLYILTDPSGEQLCLRPDLTIPSALYYLDTEQTGEVRYCYQGTAFRYQQRDSGRSEEFTQIGLEIMGGANEKADDARVLRHIIKFIKNAGVDLAACEVTIADAQHFTNMVDQYDFSEPIATTIKRQLTGNVNLNTAREILEKIIASMSSNDVMPAVTTAQITLRTAAEITDGLKRKKQFSQSDVKKLNQFVEDLENRQINFGNASILTHGEKSAYQENLSDVASKMGVRAFMDIGYSANVTYYTGISFEIHFYDSDLDGNLITIARGGRYDDLLQRLGAKKPIPAVGGAIDLERLQQAAQMSKK